MGEMSKKAYEKYAAGTINGRTMDEYDTDGDLADDMLEEMFSEGITRVGERMVGLSETRGIMVVKHAMKTIIKAEPELKESLDRLINHYFCRYRTTAVSIMSGSADKPTGTPNIGRGKFNILTADKCVKRLVEYQNKRM